jgi:DNA-binding NarL/FixJ family response regulator
MLNETTTVGIFEDNHADRFLYRQAIEKLPGNNTCFVFETPEQGYSVAPEISFDIILFNVHFWGTDFGLTLYHKLREICSPTTRFIAITSFLQAGDLEKLRHHGLDLCYEKPGVFNEFHKIISDKSFRYQSTRNRTDSRLVQ